MRQKLRLSGGNCSDIGNNHLNVMSDFRADIVQIWPQFVNCEQNVKKTPFGELIHLDNLR